MELLVVFRVELILSNIIVIIFYKVLPFLLKWLDLKPRVQTII